MTIHSACHAKHAATTEYAATTHRAPNRAFGRPKCPRCGSMLLVAEESEFNLAGCIRHAWACDDCNHEFVTSIRVWPH